MPSPRTLEEDDVAYRAYCDSQMLPQTLPDNTPPMWMIRYADVDRSDEFFAGEGAELAARRRFDAQRCAWTISLYQEVARG